MIVVTEFLFILKQTEFSLVYNQIEIYSIYLDDTFSIDMAPNGIRLVTNHACDIERISYASSLPDI